MRITVFKFLTCPFHGCPQHRDGKRGGLSSRAALIEHIRCSHKSHVHCADIRTCQEANVHICGLCLCSVYSSRKKLEQHCRVKHSNKRTQTNTSICREHLMGTQALNCDDRWGEALRFIQDNLQPDPATFRSGLTEKVSNELRDKFDSMFAGVIQAYVTASQHYVGEEASR